MRDLLETIGYVLVIGLIIGCSAAESKNYTEMTEAEQVVAMEKLVQASNADRQTLSKNGQDKAIVFRGDSNLDMIYLESTYPHHVSKKDLRRVKSMLKKISYSPSYCERLDVLRLNRIGINFQPIMRDLSGQIVYEGEVCPVVTVAADM